MIKIKKFLIFLVILQSIQPSLSAISPTVLYGFGYGFYGITIVNIILTTAHSFNLFDRCTKINETLPLINPQDPAQTGYRFFVLENIMNKKEQINKRNRYLLACGIGTTFLSTVAGSLCLFYAASISS